MRLKQLKQLKRGTLNAFVLKGAALAVLAGVVGGCNLSEIVGPSGGGGVVEAPDEAYRKPEMDYTKIDKVAVFPLFPSGDIQEDQFAESLVNRLSGAVTQEQSQWEVMSYQDVHGAINTNQLGQGYKNLQADFNTFGGFGGQLVMSEQTEQFLSELQAATGADAFLIGTYKLGSTREMRTNPLTNERYVEQVPTCETFLTLYHADSGETWWWATAAGAGDRDEIVQAIGQSLGTHVGQGTLRQ